jgi:hypothetical protein
MNDEQNKMGAGRPFKMNNWLTALKGVLLMKIFYFK